MRRLELEWRKFWKLVVVCFDSVRWTKWTRKTYWKCKCECWNEIITSSNRLQIWKTKSCWCLKNMDKKIHWMTQTSFYHVWIWIKARCDNPKTKWYYNRWGRWIKNLWNSFEEFKSDMYLSYQEHSKLYWWRQTTIDRINVNWNYCKENCRRATMKEQGNNIRKNITITIWWFTKNLMERIEIYRNQKWYSKTKCYKLYKENRDEWLSDISSIINP